MLALAASLAAAFPVRAGSLPPRAEVGVTPGPGGIDLASFRQVVSSRYHVHFRVVVAADIDRDGDVDVLASTDHSFTVWVNDGTGHLRVRRLPKRTVVGAEAPGNTWSGREHRTDPTIQGAGSTSPVLVARAHAPPASGADPGHVFRTARLVHLHFRRSSPRAPPRIANRLS